MNSSFLMPITFWNDPSLVFRISTICITPNFKKLLTGSYKGQLCIWDLSIDNYCIKPITLLLGHKDTVTCIASTDEYFISCCEGKVLCKWNLDDGYCYKKSTSLFIHRKMQLYKLIDAKNEFLFTCGDYSDIFITHSVTLQVIFIFRSYRSNFWLSSFQVIKSGNKHVVSGITINGCVKLWTFDNTLTDLSRENQSYELPVTNVVDFKYNFSLTQVLIVMKNCWMLYDSDFSNYFCKNEVENNEKLLRGHFWEDNVILCTNQGKFYLYNVSRNEPELISVFLDYYNKISIFEPSSALVITESKKFLVKGNSQGKITFWILNSQLNESYPTFYSTLSDCLKGSNAFFNDYVEQSTITTSIYVSKIDKFFVGCYNGFITSIPASEALMSFYFPSAFKKPYTDTFLGHTGKVNCLLYPYEKYSYYDQSFLVSGGSDFSVCLWDIFSKELLYKFCVQGGEILQLLTPPEDCNLPIKLSICSVSSDHSIALLNLKDRRCLILTSRHEFPIVSVHWKPIDDFVIIECFDGTIYVWQMETGHLDRILSGISAQEVIYACHTTESSALDFNFYINENNLFKNPVEKNIYSILKKTNNSPFGLQKFLINESSESQIFFCDLESAFKNFIFNFESEKLDCVQNKNHYLLTKAISNDSLKYSLNAKNKNERHIFHKESCDLEYIKFKGNCDYQILNNINSSTSKKLVNLVKFFLSLIHYWDLDPALDEFFSLKLGLFKPERDICFGIMSENEIYSLFFPKTENYSRKSSYLFSYICIAVKALTKILLASKCTTFTGLLKEFSFYDLTCVDSNENSRYMKPKIEILTKAWQNKCLPLRKLSRKLVSNYIHSLNDKELATLLEFWYDYLPHFTIIDKTLSEKVDFENLELKTVALILFGIVGADLKFKFNSCNSTCPENYIYQTCSSFVYLLLLPNSQKLHFGSLPAISIDFIGRGYIVWEHFLKMEKITPMLFKISAESNNENVDIQTQLLEQYNSSHNALKAIAVVRTAAFIDCLKNEVNQIKTGQNHVFINQETKTEVLSVLIYLLDETPYIMLLYLNEAISLIIYCIDFTHLRQENLTTLIPTIQKFRQVHHSVPSQRIAVGLATGGLALHDLKSGKVYDVLAHKDSVSALKFSEDGKFLVSYSCYENRLCFWQILTGIFGLGNINIKCTKSCETYRIHDEEIRNHFEIASLTWTDKKSVLLSLCDGTKDIFQF